MVHALFSLPLLEAELSSAYKRGRGKGACTTSTHLEQEHAAPGARDDKGQEGDVDDNKFDEFMGNDAGE
eukprot:1161098-Pelagomonas_calceolata.AAC.11